MKLLAPKVNQEWGTTIWGNFACPRCGAHKGQFCRRWPYWHSVFLDYIGDRYHEERVCAAIIACDDDYMKPYTEGWAK
jgi:hypothetical protein